MSNLRTNYKDDVFTGKRKYSEIDNGDGTISFDDVTNYAQVGDTYGAAQINETNDVINNLDSKAYKNTDSSETTIADNDYFPFYDASASASKKTLWSNIKSILTNVFAIKTHSSSATTYGPGSETLYGHVKLSDSYQSSAGAAASAIGASSKAVYDSYTANKNSITSLSGTVAANKLTETEHYNTLTSAVNGKAPTNHKSENTTYGVGNALQYGHLKLTDTPSANQSIGSGIAASGYAVYSAHQAAMAPIGALQNQLKANDNSFYFDYKDGKYGYNTSANRGADTFHPFKQAYESLGSANCDISIGATTTVSINLSKVPDFYTVGILSIRANAGHHSEDERFVTIMDSSISGNTCTVTLAHDSKTDGHDVNVSVTIVVYGC